MIYKASYDNTTKILSTLIVGASVFIALLALKQISSDAAINGFQAKHALKLLLPLFLFLIVGIAFLFSINEYAIENNSLVIYRRKGKIIIPKNEIQEAKLITIQDTGMVFRTFGVGGLFGYYGKFHSAKLGTLILYTTQNSNRVLITTNNGKKIVITPDDLSLIKKIS